MTNVLVVVAHPDDEVLGMGGAISKFVREDWCRVTVIFVGTNPFVARGYSPSVLNKNKYEMSLNAAGVLGYSDIQDMGLPVLMLDKEPSFLLAEKIKEICAKYPP